MIVGMMTAEEKKEHYDYHKKRKISLWEAYKGEGRIVSYYSNKYHIQAIILDTLLRCEEISLLDLERAVLDGTPTINTELDMPYNDFQRYLNELLIFEMVVIKDIDEELRKKYLNSEANGFLELIEHFLMEQELKSKTYLCLTEKGLKAVESQTFQSNALSALSARLVRRLSFISVIIALLGVATSIIIAIIN